MAQDALPKLTLSGFGTAGAGVVEARGDTSLNFRRDQQLAGVDPGKADFGLDSNLGLQANVQLGEAWSLAGQWLLRRRDQRDPSGRLEWAFAQWSAANGVDVRLGRIASPGFLMADSRWVGYGHAAVRPAEEVYGLALNHNIDGADVQWRRQTSDGQVWEATLAAGQGHEQGGSASPDMRDLMALTLVWRPHAAWQLRAGSTTGRVLRPGQSNDRYRFHTLGLTWDAPRGQVQFELARRRSSEAPDMIDAQAWSLFVGPRFGAWQPYGRYAQLHSRNPERGLSGVQTTHSLGLRWDAWLRAAIKFQFDRVDAAGTAGAGFITRPGGMPPPLPSGSPAPGAPGTAGAPPIPPVAPSAMLARPVRVFSLSVDFIF